MFVTILRHNCAKFDFRLSLHCSPDPLAVSFLFKGPVSKGKEGKGEKMGSEEGKNGGKGSRKV